MTTLAPGGQTPQNIAMQRYYDSMRQGQMPNSPGQMPNNPGGHNSPMWTPRPAPFGNYQPMGGPLSSRSGGGYRGPTPYTSIGRGGIDFSNFPR